MQDVILLRQMVANGEADEARKRVETQKLDAMLTLCEQTDCRRKTLLAYFGETRDEPCGNCDNCLSPPETFDGTKHAQMALSCAYRTEQRFGMNYLIDVLMGKADERIIRNRHDQTSVFGIGEGVAQNVWRNIFRQLVAGGMIHADAERHGALVLTEKARPLLRGETEFHIRKSRAPAQGSRGRGRGRGSAKADVAIKPGDQQLWEALKALRLRLAQKQNKPP